MNRKSSAYYQAQRARVFERDKGCCIVCLRPGEQIHHRQGRGGPNPHRLSNLILVCATHHQTIHANPEHSYRSGWMVRRNGIATTDTTPVRYGDLMVTLTDQEDQ